MRTVVVLAVISWATALVGDLIASLIFDSQPELLLAMNPRLRYLVNAANEVAPVPYAVIGFARLVASDPLYYLLGFWYGDRAIAWTARRSRTYGPLVEDGQRLFLKAAYPIVFIAPNSLVSALAATSGMAPRVFFSLNLSGTVVRLVAVWYIGGLIEDQVDWVQNWIGGNRIWLLALSAIAVAWTLFGEFRGNDSEIANLRSLADDEDGDNEAAGEAADGPRVAVDGRPAESGDGHAEAAGLGGASDEDVGADTEAERGPIDTGPATGLNGSVYRLRT
ncbi:MAG: hypothetical protein AAFN30_02880 [Actinomycetota bacterium]